MKNVLAEIEGRFVGAAAVPVAGRLGENPI
jgi:hypothetical protein